MLYLRQFALLIASFMFCTMAQAVDENVVREAQDAQKELHVELLEQVRRDFEVLRQRELSTTDAQELRKLKKEQIRLADLVAEIERRIERPPRTYYSSPARKSPIFDSYRSHVAQRIEALGTSRFPTSESGSLYGRVLVNIGVNSSGAVESVDVVKSSGVAELDRHAVRTVRAAAPFKAFSREMRSLADRLVLVFPFDYTRQDGK